MTQSSIDGFSTASQMLQALRQRQLSAVELLALHQRRIERYNPRLNAIAIECSERAREAAEAADAARARGADAALLGLPITLKESMNVRGLPTTAGLPAFAQARADFDAAATQRMQTAGTVLMGKTNVPPMLADWQSDNDVYGRTNNPWDHTRTPGGNTGKGAAALATKLTPLETGSDIGGSIRVPAAFCGLYGHRPSDSALPRSGQLSFPPVPNPLGIMGVQGPLARSAADLALALDVLAGPEGGEEVAWRLAFPPPRHERLSAYRVAVLPPIAWVPVDAEIMAAQEELVSRLSRAGAHVNMVQPELLGDVRAHHVLYVSLISAVTGARSPEAERCRLVELSRGYDDGFSEARRQGWLASVGDYFTW